jgi:2-amino-4-hydroxy-6-hydroxymethyldihydropteridine diphosphokinase
MVALTTALAPEALLGSLQRIERSLGRVRGVRWGARTIDLDLVRHGDRRMRSEALELPHPGLPSRAFWQRELAELARVMGAAA